MEAGTPFGYIETRHIETTPFKSILMDVRGALALRLRRTIEDAAQKMLNDNVKRTAGQRYYHRASNGKMRKY